METVKSKSLSLFIFIPLLCLIFIRPFFSDLAYPALEIYYENCLIFLAVTMIFFNKGLSLKTPYSMPVFLILMAYLISTFMSLDFQNSIKETIKFISYISVFLLASALNEKQGKIIIRAVVLTASIVSVYVIYQNLWGYDRTIDYLEKTKNEVLFTQYGIDILFVKRAIGTFPSPNILGGYLILSLFLSFRLIKLQKKWLPSALLILIALTLTKSIGIWIVLIAIFIFMALHLKGAHKKSGLVLIIIFLLLIFVLCSIVASRWDYRLVNPFEYQNPITQRLNYWRTSVGIIKNNPLFGVGPGNFHLSFLRYESGQETVTRYAHNILLHAWSETGILGLAGIICLIISFIKRYAGKRSISFIFLAGLAFIMHNLIDNTYFISQAGVFWWILLGLSLSEDSG